MFSMSSQPMMIQSWKLSNSLGFQRLFHRKFEIFNLLLINSHHFLYQTGNDHVCNFSLEGYPTWRSRRWPKRIFFGFLIFAILFPSIFNLHPRGQLALMLFPVTWFSFTFFMDWFCKNIKVIGIFLFYFYAIDVIFCAYFI